MKNLLLCVLFVVSAKALSQLSGTVTLSGQTNHSGVKIKIIAVSSSAVTDSAFTLSNGSFTMPITNGIYKVEFSKPGYVPANYNGSNTVTLSNSTTLTPWYINPGNGVIVSGTVSGTWNNTNVYYVNGDLTVMPTDSLIIQPGTIIKFDGIYGLSAGGILRAGSANGSPVLFTSNQPTITTSDWGGISLYNSQSIIENCIIEYCRYPIYVYNAGPTIQQNELRYFSLGGIYLHSSNVLVSNNVKVYNNVIRDFTGIGMACVNRGTVDVQCNSIYNGSGKGILFWVYGQIKNNIIYNIVSSSIQNGYGIDCDYQSNVRIDNNIIYSCVSGIHAGSKAPPTGSTPLITNNTLYWNKNGILIGEFDARPTICNNLIVSNTVGINQATCNGCVITPSIISNNNVWNNSAANYSNVVNANIGQTSGMNTNGDACDPYANISFDPLFVNNSPPNYSAVSPCTGAGNSAYSSNIGCEVNKLCTGMTVGLSEFEIEKKVRTYPNPATDLFRVDFEGNKNTERYDIYNIQGKLELSVQKPETNEISVSHLENGMYLLKVTFADQTNIKTKIVKQE